MIIDGNRLIAEEGMFLANYTQKIIAEEVILGKYDSVENWKEITEQEKERLEAEWVVIPDAE